MPHWSECGLPQSLKESEGVQRVDKLGDTWEQGIMKTPI